MDGGRQLDVEEAADEVVDAGHAAESRRLQAAVNEARYVPLVAGQGERVRVRG